MFSKCHDAFETNGKFCLMRKKVTLLGVFNSIISKSRQDINKKLVASPLEIQFLIPSTTITENIFIIVYFQ